LDEADEMLSRGFKDAMYDVFQYLPANVQVCLFSATMPVEVHELTKKFLRDPIEILVKQGQLTLDGIAQYYIDVEEDQWKVDTLCDLYEEISVAQTIIFCNTQRRVEVLQDQLNAQDFTVSIIHGGMSTDQRNEAMQAFKMGASRILVSTDLLARGIDVYEVQVVINYDLPRDRESYIHRIGRSGRFGRKGIAINFITQRDAGALRDLMQFYQTVIDPLPGDIAGVFA
jgi:translation initiation factor 4A